MNLLLNVQLLPKKKTKKVSVKYAKKYLFI